MRFALALYVLIGLASSSPAHAGWTFAGDTLYRSYTPSRGMDVLPDGMGGILAGLHFWQSSVYDVRVFRVGADGSPIGT